MRARIENWLLGHWYGPSMPPWYLQVLETVYRFALQRSQRQLPAGLKQPAAAVPLIIVGNITAGGSGKTPLVMALCRIAVGTGLRPGIISKGYGRKRNETVVVGPDCSADECGDEPVLLAQRTRLPVVVAADRARAVDRLKQMGVEVVFSDDGLQQADLPRSLEFCVIDGARGLGNGHLIPAGPLREPAERLFSFDYVVTNGEWAGKPEMLPAVPMQLCAGEVHSLDGEVVYSVAQFLHKHGGNPVQAVAGIGHPQRFFDMLGGFGLEVVPHRFRDHHDFSLRDFATLNGTIVMTEKDAVKCRQLGLQNAWYVPVDSRLPKGFEDEFAQKLSSLVKDSR